MVVLGFIMLVVIFLFLFLGGLLYLFAGAENIRYPEIIYFPVLPCTICRMSFPSYLS